MTLKTTQKETTKRGVLSQLASIYDPLGLASPTSLIGEQLYRDNKTPWNISFPYHQPISQLTLHAFGDASVNGVCTAVYAVVHQGEIVTLLGLGLATRMRKVQTGEGKSDNSYVGAHRRPHVC